MMVCMLLCRPESEYGPTTDLDLLCAKLSEVSSGGSELFLEGLLDNQAFSVSS